MYIHGEFVNRKSQTVSVEIVTGGDRTQTLEIGASTGGAPGGVWFSDDPVEIESEMNDTFDHLLPHSATVRLLTDRHIPSLYTSLATNSPVNISVDGELVFAGFVEPLSYSQPFVSVADELEINCVDCLSALQYSRFKNVGTAGVDYSQVTATAGKASFLSLMSEMLDSVTTSANIGGGEVHYYYDGSKAESDTADRYALPSTLTISEMLFLGEDEEDADTQDKVLEELMRYLNLHIEQRGLDFYIFDWATLKSSTSNTWKCLKTGSFINTYPTAVTLTMQNVADDSTELSMAEVYNQISVECDVTKLDTLVTSPLDESYMTSPYKASQLYLAHMLYQTNRATLVSFPELYRALCQAARNRAVDNLTYDYSGNATVNEYKIRVMQHEHWTFPMSGDESTDLVEHFADQGQWELPNWLGTHLGACLLRVGKATYTPVKTDDNPTSKMSYETMLYIGKPTGAMAEAQLQANIPLAVYKGGRIGARIAPVDTATTNYIVFTGKIVLVGSDTMPVIDGWQIATDSTYAYYADTDLMRKDSNGKYLASSFGQWETDNDSDDTWELPVLSGKGNRGFVPYEDKFEKQFKYKYSTASDRRLDNLKKLSILACQLVIGDKCLVEVDLDGGGSYFTWNTYKTMEQCASADEYYQQCFYIGFNPKIDDYIINQEYDIANNITVAMGLDTDGMAVPIKSTDNLSGDVQFKILGPVNEEWDEVTKRHKTWFRSSKYSANAVNVLEHTKSIILKQFEVKVMSDNGQFDVIDENDLIYTSDTDESYYNVNDSTTFRITSDLTTQEAAALGVKNYVKLSAPYIGGNPVTAIYDRTKDVTSKPEQLYVDSYWQEWHQPRVCLTQAMEGLEFDRFSHIRHRAIDGGDFFVEGASYNLMEATTTVKAKQIEP